MKKIILSACVALMTLHIYAGSSSSTVKTEVTHATLKGKVIDHQTGEGLAGVEIQVIGTKQKVYTDFEGNYTIKNMETGAQAISVSTISYKPLVTNVYIKTDKENDVSIKLESK